MKPISGSVDCDFEDPHICGYRNAQWSEGYFKWTRITSQKLKGLGIKDGPATDATQNTYAGNEFSTTIKSVLTQLITCPLVYMGC